MDLSRVVRVVMTFMARTVIGEEESELISYSAEVGDLHEFGLFPGDKYSIPFVSSDQCSPTTIDLILEKRSFEMTPNGEYVLYLRFRRVLSYPIVMTGEQCIHNNTMLGWKFIVKQRKTT